MRNIPTAASPTRCRCRSLSLLLLYLGGSGAVKVQASRTRLHEHEEPEHGNSHSQKDYRKDDYYNRSRFPSSLIELVSSANADVNVEPPLEPMEHLENLHLDVYILAGQSNAHGVGWVPDLFHSQQQANETNEQDGWFYTSWHRISNNAESTQYYSDWATSLRPGFTRDTLVRSNVASPYLGGSPLFGPELGFVYELNRLLYSNKTKQTKIGILKYAVDGSALVATPENRSDWDVLANNNNDNNTSTSSTRDGDCWRGLQRALRNGLSKLQSNPKVKSYTLKGLLWWQGESGTNVPRLKRFLAEVRTLVGDPQWPVVITYGEWADELREGVADPDPFVESVDARRYGQFLTNIHIGSGQHGASRDTTRSGNNDVWDIGLAYARRMHRLLQYQQQQQQSVQQPQPTAPYIMYFLTLWVWLRHTLLPVGTQNVGIFIK